MSNSILKTLQKRNVTEREIDTELRKLTRDTTLLTFNVLSSKQMSSEARKKYLRRIIELFSVEELSTKWKTNKTTIYKFYINNDLPVFEGKNQFEKEINILLNTGYKHNDVRRKLHSIFSDYSLKSILDNYGIIQSEMEYYCHVVGINLHSYYIGSDCATEALPNGFSLSLSDGEVLKLKRNETQVMALTSKTTVDMNSGIVLKTVFSEPVKKVTNTIKSNELETLYKTPISIITFLSFSEKDRINRLKTLSDYYNLKDEEIEKLLGIPSREYLRKLKTRHLIFNFYNKEKLKEALSKLKTFEECRDFVFSIIKNGEYKKYNVSEKTFIKFADDYFDIVKKKDGWQFDDWDTFCKKIVKQAVYVYKKNTRVTNLTEEEVLEFEKDNRKVVSDRDLIRITRTTIKEIHDDNQNWISIFDFKTAIEKEGFELDSNDRIISIIDDLIAKKSFKNDYFTLKKIQLDNPILSADSSIRWEFVSTKAVTTNTDNTTSKETKVNRRSKKFVKREKKTNNIVKEDTPVVNPPKNTVEINTGRKDFLSSNIISLSFNESNIEDVIDFVKTNFKLFGSGNATITISKLD